MTADQLEARATFARLGADREAERMNRMP